MQSAGSDSTWFYELLAWLQDHSMQVIAGGVMVLGAIFLGYTYQWHREKTELEASAALFALTQTSGEEAPQPAAFTGVAEEFASTAAAERALLLAAGNLYDEAQYAEAQQAFERFLREHAGSPLAPIAALGVAASLDAQQKVDAAITAYQNVISSHAGDPVAERAQLNLAAIYESQDKPGDALRLYEAMTAEGRFSQAAMQAMSRRELLLRDHPELAPQPTNETSAALSPTPLVPELAPVSDDAAANPPPTLSLEPATPAVPAETNAAPEGEEPQPTAEAPGTVPAPDEPADDTPPALSLEPPRTDAPAATNAPEGQTPAADEAPAPKPTDPASGSGG